MTERHTIHRPVAGKEAMNVRLLMFDGGQGRRLGVLDPAVEAVLDLREIAAGSGAAPPPADLVALIDEGRAGLDRVRALLERAGRAPGAPLSRPLPEVRVLAPLDPPRGNVLAIGRNYGAHVQESARARNETAAPPTVFTKAVSAITGPYDDIPIDVGISREYDWEVELGVVIGRRGANIARADAREHVFGYTVVNDVSVRDVQYGWGGQFFKGKSFDGSCPSGPWVVTADEVPNPQELRLRLSVNGTVKQDASTSDMIYGVDALVEWLSIGMTLLPGTLIATGTPEGVGFARRPPEFLQDGDLMESEVVGLGALRNRIVARAAGAAAPERAEASLSRDAGTA